MIVTAVNKTRNTAAGGIVYRETRTGAASRSGMNVGRAVAVGVEVAVMKMVASSSRIVVVAATATAAAWIGCCMIGLICWLSESEEGMKGCDSGL